MKICKCGCGKEIENSNLFVHGHNRRKYHYDEKELNQFQEILV